MRFQKTTFMHAAQNCNREAFTHGHSPPTDEILHPRCNAPQITEVNFLRFLGRIPLWSLFRILIVWAHPVELRVLGKRKKGKHVAIKWKFILTLKKRMAFVLAI
jgi:hypothetical protein